MHLIVFSCSDPESKCGGALVSPRIVLSGFHCYKWEGKLKLCPEKRYEDFMFVILGHHHIEPRKNSSYYRQHYNTIPVVELKAPEKAGLSVADYGSHDFIMLVLKG